MKNKLSVCIMAYNEQETIKKCIKSILNQENVIIDEILVGVNSSTDNTISIVDFMAKNDRRIKVINSDKGKANAWNAVNLSARNNLRIFMDADCYLYKDSIYNLLKDMNDEVIIGGTLKYDIVNASIASKIIHFPKVLYSNYYEICGALYLIDYEKLKVQMSLMGFKEMPKNIIAEDKWLALISKNVNISRSAIVVTRAANIKDQILRNKRFILSNRQLKDEYPNLNNTVFENNKTKSIWKQLMNLKVREILIYIAIMPLKKCINLYIIKKAQKLVQNEKYTEFIWEKINSNRE